MEPVECKSVQKSSRLGGFLIYRFQFKILGIRSGNSASTPEPGRLEFLLVIFRDEILRRREGLAEDDECVKFLSFLLVTSSRRQIESASVKRMMTAGWWVAFGNSTDVWRIFHLLKMSSIRGRKSNSTRSALHHNFSARIHFHSIRIKALQQKASNLEMSFLIRAPAFAFCDVH